jgi:hypothetical protein
VVTALIRLGSPITEDGTIAGYLNSFCHLFSNLAAVCGVSGVKGLRKLDNALFSYGAESSFPASALSVSASGSVARRNLTP